MRWRVRLNPRCTRVRSRGRGAGFLPSPRRGPWACAAWRLAAAVGRRPEGCVQWRPCRAAQTEDEATPAVRRRIRTSRVGTGRTACEGSKTPVNGAKSEPETDEFAQPSEEDGVPEDMATLVLDNPALGQGARAEPGRAAKARQLRDGRVQRRGHYAAGGGGRRGRFQLPGGKYHRAMIHFLFRMVHNQAVAEELAQEVFLRVYRSRRAIGPKPSSPPGSTGSRPTWR